MLRSLPPAPPTPPLVPPRPVVMLMLSLLSSLQATFVTAPYAMSPMNATENTRLETFFFMPLIWSSRAERSIPRPP